MRLPTSSGIYLIRCHANGKVYVGQTTNLRRRWSAHNRLLKLNRHHCPPLQNAWNKYGEREFSVDLLLPVVDVVLLNVFEVWAFALVPKTSMFNVGSPGASMLGRKHTEETRRKMSASRRGVKLGAEHRLKISETLKNHTVSEETRAKLRATRVGVPQSAETRRNMSKAQQNRTPEHLKNIADANRGAKRSDETRRNISEAIKKHWEKRRNAQENHSTSSGSG